MRITRILLLIASALLISVSAAKADSVVSGSGTWGDGATNTTESAPGATWSFSFLVTTPTTDALAVEGGVVTEQVSNFAYFLNGTQVSVSLVDAIFFDQEDLGLFDLDLSDGNTISFYGDQVFGGTPPNITLSDGVYQAGIAMNDADPEGSGTVAIRTVSTPEPGTLTLLCAAFLGLALTRFWKN